MNKFQTVAVSFSAPAPLIATTRVIAETEDKTFSAVVREALAEYTARYAQVKAAV